MANPLTPRQKQALDFIQKFSAKHGTVPSLRELAKGLGASGHEGMRKHVEALAEKGYLARREGQHRGIQLPRGAELVIPVYGKVAAGRPIEAAEHVQREVPVPVGLFRRDPDFLYEVSGDSMVDELIFDGDLAAFRRVESAEPGQIVLAALDVEGLSRDELAECGIARNGLTLKRLSMRGGNIVLKSANRAKGYAPFELEPRAVKIAGVFLGSIRVHGQSRELS